MVRAARSGHRATEYLRIVEACAAKCAHEMLEDVIRARGSIAISGSSLMDDLVAPN